MLSLSPYLQGFAHFGQSGETSHAIFLAALSVTQFLNKMSILTKVNLQKELKMTDRCPLNKISLNEAHSHLHEEFNNYHL